MYILYLCMWFFLSLVFLPGCSTESMSEHMAVGFVKGVKIAPEKDFSPKEKENIKTAKANFKKLLNPELRRKLEERDLADLKGWQVVLRVYTDATTKTVRISLYTYWGEEDRAEIMTIPLESFLDKEQLPAIAEKAADEVTKSLALKRADLLKSSHTVKEAPQKPQSAKEARLEK